jgi:hypothetical protein
MHSLLAVQRSTGGTARDCELEARDCDALVKQGLPDGFTALCEQTCQKNCAIAANDNRGGDYECWKKMPEKDIDEAEGNGTKTAYMSVGGVLAMVGSAVLLHL